MIIENFLTKKTLLLMGEKENEPVITEVLYLDDLFDYNGVIKSDVLNAVKIKIPFLSDFIQEVKRRLGNKKPSDRRILNSVVKSSNLKSIAYAPAIGMLECVFNKQNRIYVYFDVPKKVYDGLLKAPSKGKYHWQYIRFNYDYEEL